MAGSVHRTRTPISQTSPDLSRRTLFLGLPAAALGVAALTAPALAAAPHPDAALLALELQLKPLNAQYDRVSEAWEAAEAAYAAARDALPNKRRKRQAELDRLRAKHGVDAAREASQDAARRVNARHTDFANARAKTLDGLKAKARWAEMDDSLQPSIVRDVLAM